MCLFPLCFLCICATSPSELENSSFDTLCQGSKVGTSVTSAEHVIPVFFLVEVLVHDSMQLAKLSSELLVSATLCCLILSLSTGTLQVVGCHRVSDVDHLLGELVATLGLASGEVAGIRGKIHIAMEDFIIGSSSSLLLEANCCSSR